MATSRQSRHTDLGKRITGLGENITEWVSDHRHLLDDRGKIWKYTKYAMIIIAIVIVLPLAFNIIASNSTSNTDIVDSVKEKAAGVLESSQTKKAKAELLKPKNAGSYLASMTADGIHHNLYSIPRPSKAEQWFTKVSYKQAEQQNKPLQYFRLELIHPKSKFSSIAYSSITYHAMAEVSANNWVVVGQYNYKEYRK